MSGLMELVRFQYEALRQQIDEQAEQSRKVQSQSEKALLAFSLEVVTYADRPLAADGMVTPAVLIISDALDVGETTGNGTGCLAFYKPTLNDWYRVADNTLVAT